MATNSLKFRELANGATLHSGKYKIEKLLGVGGFGITYYAKHYTLNKHYAIKEFFISGYCVRNTKTSRVHLQGIEQEDYDKFKQKFIDEAQTLAKLHHSNIVEVIDVFEENGTSYIVMSFVEGTTLQGLVKQNGAMDYAVAVNYIAQLSEAIDYIHSNNILHRDITPDNIIITPDDKIVLIDFGSAREFIHDKTQNHTAILKKGYAPLEQYSATSRKGTYTDIYSLGAVFYFTLTGQKPMDATERTMENMTEPKALCPSIPEYANRTIIKAMSLPPESRHQSIREFMDDLLNKKPLIPVPRFDLIKRNIRRIIKNHFIIIILGLIVLAGGLVALGLWQRKAAKVDANHKIYVDLMALAQQNQDRGEDYFSEALTNYQQANEYESLYLHTSSADRFSLGAETKKIALENRRDSLFTVYKNTAQGALEMWDEFEIPDEKSMAIAWGERALRLKYDAELAEKINELKE